jgi:hypothetical protein
MCHKNTGYIAITLKPKRLLSGILARSLFLMGNCMNLGQRSSLIRERLRKKGKKPCTGRVSMLVYNGEIYFDWLSKKKKTWLEKKDGDISGLMQCVTIEHTLHCYWAAVVQNPAIPADPCQLPTRGFPVVPLPQQNFDLNTKSCE